MDQFKIFFYVAVAIGWYVLKNYNKVKQNRPVIKKENVKPKDTVIKNVPESVRAETPDWKITQTNPAIKKANNVYTKNKEANTFRRNQLKKKAAAPFLTTDMPPLSSTVLPDTIKNKETTEINKKIIEEDAFVIKNFDIRSAIIYSEILKRPEY